MIENHQDLLNVIADIESKYFRTHSDTGATTNALFVWNQLRQAADLPKLTEVDLMVRARATIADDLVKAVLRDDQESVEHIKATIAEFDEVLAAENPAQALRVYKESFRKLQATGR